MLTEPECIVISVKGYFYLKFMDKDWDGNQVCMRGTKEDVREEALYSCNWKLSSFKQ